MSARDLLSHSTEGSHDLESVRGCAHGPHVTHVVRSLLTLPPTCGHVPMAPRQLLVLTWHCRANPGLSGRDVMMRYHMSGLPRESQLIWLLLYLHIRLLVWLTRVRMWG